MYVAADVLQLSNETRFTSIVLLHRYAAAIVQSTTSPKGSKDDKTDVALGLTADDWPWVGGTCIFLACKTEEEPRRLRDIINMIFMVLSINENEEEKDKTTKGMDLPQQPVQEKEPATLHMMATPPMLDDQYWQSKQRVIDTEQAVLRWLGFDCFVSHPHRAVVLVLEQQQQLGGAQDGTADNCRREPFRVHAYKED